MKNSFSGLCLLLCFSCLPAFSVSQEKEIDKVGIKSPNLKTRTEAAKAESIARSKYISQLLAVAKAKDPQPELFCSKLLAINLLAEYRAVEAVDFLIENVSLRLPAFNSEIPRMLGYQCAEALIPIGSPSIDGIFRRFRKPCSELEITLFAKVIYFIDQKEIGLLRLQIGARDVEKLATVDGRTARENFQKTIDEFKKFTKDRSR